MDCSVKIPISMMTLHNFKKQKSLGFLSFSLEPKSPKSASHKSQNLFFINLFSSLQYVSSSKPFLHKIIFISPICFIIARLLAQTLIEYSADKRSSFWGCAKKGWKSLFLKHQIWDRGHRWNIHRKMFRKINKTTNIITKGKLPSVK